VVEERFHFHRRSQAVGENIAEYVAELRRLSTDCQFGAYLEEALRDRLVCGICSEAIQRRLLTQSELTFDEALKIAQGMEAADLNVQQVKGANPTVQFVSSRMTPSQAVPNLEPPVISVDGAVTTRQNANSRMSSVTHVESGDT